MRELRGPFVAHHLVTNKASEAEGYQENKYWLNRLEDTDGEIVQDVAEALATLSQTVDGVIEQLKS